MKHVIHIFAARRAFHLTVAALVLAACIGVGSLVFTHGVVHACGSSVVAGSTTVIKTDSPAVSISFSLWYNSCNSQNYTSSNVTSGSAIMFRVTVVRLSGADGGSISQTNYGCPNSGVCNSPGVYSPNNKSYSEIVFVVGGNPTYTVDTSAF